MKASTGRAIRTCVPALLLGMIAAAGAAAGADAREIVRRAVLADQQNWQEARNYGFPERVDERRLNSAGSLDGPNWPECLAPAPRARARLVPDWTDSYSAPPA